MTNETSQTSTTGGAAAPATKGKGRPRKTQAVADADGKPVAAPAPAKEKKQRKPKKDKLAVPASGESPAVVDDSTKPKKRTKAAAAAAAAIGTQTVQVSDVVKIKKPPTAYSLFQKAEWAKIKAAGGSQPVFGDVTKMLSAKWNSLGDADKAPFHAEASRQKADHDAKVAHIRPVKKNTGPKKPKNAFIFFFMDENQQYREKHAGMPNNDVMREIAKVWKGVPADVKAKYERRAAEDKARFQSELGKPAPLVSAQA